VRRHGAEVNDVNQRVVAAGDYDLAAFVQKRDGVHVVRVYSCRGRVGGGEGEGGGRGRGA
jgi:hypothetical protein